MKKHPSDGNHNGWNDDPRNVMSQPPLINEFQHPGPVPKMRWRTVAKMTANRNSIVPVVDSVDFCNGFEGCTY
jgi:hypothetical protein